MSGRIEGTTLIIPVGDTEHRLEVDDNGYVAVGEGSIRVMFKTEGSLVPNDFGIERVTGVLANDETPAGDKWEFGELGSPNEHVKGGGPVGKISNPTGDVGSKGGTGGNLPLGQWFDEIKSKVRSGAHLTVEEQTFLDSYEANMRAEFAKEDLANKGGETADTTDTGGGASMDSRFRGPVIVEGIQSGDRREIAVDALVWRDFSSSKGLPLMMNTTTTQGHNGAVFVGNMDSFERVKQMSGSTAEIIVEGDYDLERAAGKEAQHLVNSGRLRGVSADIDMVEIELRDPDSGNLVSIEDIIFDGASYVETLVAGRIMGATLTPFPAFQEAFLAPGQAMAASGAVSFGIEVLPGAGIGASEEALVAAGGRQLTVWRTSMATQFVNPGLSSLVASGAALNLPVIPIDPPAEWFEQADYDEPIPFTVHPDGRIEGHIALWGSCHISFQGQCIPVPRLGQRGYQNVQNRNLLTEEGDMITTATIFMDTVHPDLALNASDAYSWYHDTGAQGADVRIYEDVHGIQVRGAARSDIGREAIRRLRASDVSPDWRQLRPGERGVPVALLAVNTSGFVVPQTLVASGAIAESKYVIPGEFAARWHPDTGEVSAMVGYMTRKKTFKAQQTMTAMADRIRVLEAFMANAIADQAMASVLEMDETNPFADVKAADCGGTCGSSPDEDCGCNHEPIL